MTSQSGLIPCKPSTSALTRRLSSLMRDKQHVPLTLTLVDLAQEPKGPEGPWAQKAMDQKCYEPEGLWTRRAMDPKGHGPEGMRTRWAMDPKGHGS